MLSHENLIYNGRCISAEHCLTSQDRVLGSLPLYHINALVVTLIAPLAHRGSVAMMPRFSTASFWADANRYACTWINVVPTIIAYLLNEQDGAALPEPGRLRFCRSASSALAPEHHRAFESRFGIGIIETMGLTETAAPSFSNPYMPEDRRIGSIGKPSGTRAMVRLSDGQRAKPGEKGEIVLTGDNVMLGYYKDAERTRDAFTEDGWLRTGDIGYEDEDGYFYVTGRAKELIIKGGENIAPREIDEALIKHPSILDAAAVGVPHPEYGQDIAVYLVLRDNAAFDGEALRRHCLSELGRYKTPSRYVVVDELPRGPSGKVQRLKLLELGA
jgi:long-chain acyl-CoA synthetase